MTDEQIKQYYKAVNKNILVRVKNESVTMGNGLKMQEQRGKKDYMCGTIVLFDNSLKISPKSLCWFPAYAGMPLMLDGQNLMVVPFEDVVLIENVTE